MVTRVPDQALGFAAARQVEALSAHRRDSREGVILIAVSEIVPRRERELGKAGLQIALANHHQLFGLVEAQGLQQNRVHHGEDGGIGSDSQCQGQHRNAGEPRVSAQSPEGITQVPHDRRKHG